MKIIPIALSLLFVVSCKPTKVDDSATTGVVIKKSARFKPWSNPSNIKVCMVNPQHASSTVVKSIKDAVTREYHSKTNVRFTGWNKCSNADLSKTMIRVHIQRKWNWNKSDISGGGKSTFGQGNKACASNKDNYCGRGTMNLVIGLTGDYPKKPWRQFTIDYTTGNAVHEFGHALGLGHEHYRKDGAACNGNKHDLKNGDTFEGLQYKYVGKPDRQSIMNYCRVIKKASLTPGDVASVNFLYPKKKKNKIVADEDFLIKAGSSDRCLKQNGTGYTLETCDSEDKSFLFKTQSAGDGSFLIANANDGKCLETTPTDDNIIGSSECLMAPTQRINLLPSITNAGQMRLQFSHNSSCLSSSSSTPKIVDCAEAPEMEFNFVNVDDAI